MSVNVSHDGSVPVSVNEHVAGTPAVVTVKVPACPTVKVVPARLVIWHAWLTVRVKLWVALKGAIRLRAVIVNVYVPVAPVAGIPESVAVPFPLSLNLTPDGSGGTASVADKLMGSVPVVVTG